MKIAADLCLCYARITMMEIICNLHIHTPYSDGRLYHGDLARIASEAGIDALIVTDHNVFVRGVEGWRTEGDKKVLVLVGEEIHHQDRDPQKNHLLVFGAGQDLAQFAPEPKELLEAVERRHGVSIIAHPFDPDSDMLHEDSLGWVSWDIGPFTGFELWNYMSEFKALPVNIPTALFYAFFPSMGIKGPDPRTLALWDSFLARGEKRVAVGGSDAHGQTYSLGPLRRAIFPYAHLFRAVNTHLLLEQPFGGDASIDGKAVLDAIRLGRGWVGYDLSANTRGFAYQAILRDGKSVPMGADVALRDQPVLQVKLPSRGKIRIIRAGKGIQHEAVSRYTEWRPTEAGAYRAEVTRWFRGKWRGWIYSNPVYIVG